MRGAIQTIPEDKRSLQLNYYYTKRREKSLVKVVCPCGCRVSNGNLNQHKRSKKHKLMMSLAEKHKN